MIETYKLIKGKVDTESSQYFESKYIDCRIRGRHLKMKKRRTRLLLRSHFLSNRTVNLWKKLPEGVVQLVPQTNSKTNLILTVLETDLLPKEATEILRCGH